MICGPHPGPGRAAWMVGRSPRGVHGKPPSVDFNGNSLKIWDERPSAAPKTGGAAAFGRRPPVLDLKV